MTRAVLDSNVWISGFLWRGPAHHVVELARAYRFAPITTHAILHEVSVVLVADLGTPPNRAVEIQRAILALSELVVLPSAMPQYPVRDPKDLHVIACALVAHADAIVTGDQDLLTLRQVRQIPVLTIRQLLQELAG